MNSTAKTMNATMVCKNESCLGEDLLGEKEFFSETFITIHVVVYMTVLLVGVFTNLLTCRLIISRRHMCASSDLYIFNLAVCDLFILCFYIPTQMIQIKDQLNWKMGPFMCKLVNAILPVTLSCTIFTLLAIAFDRARSMIKPFTWRTDSLEIAKILVPIIWVISLFLNVPLFLYPKIEKAGSMTLCAEGWKHRNDSERFWVFMFIFVYAFPLVILISMHVLFIIYIRKNSKMMYRQLNIRLIKMSFSLLFVFGICTGFQHFFFFITSSFSSIAEKLPVDCLAIMFVESNFLVSIQALINPFLYGNIRIFAREGKRQLRKISNVLILEPRPMTYFYRTNSSQIVDVDDDKEDDNEKNWRFNREGSFEIKSSQFLMPQEATTKKKKISFTVTFEEDVCHHKTFLGVELKICEDLLKECVLERETYL